MDVGITFSKSLSILLPFCAALFVCGTLKSKAKEFMTNDEM